MQELVLAIDVFNYRYDVPENSVISTPRRLEFQEYNQEGEATSA
jgi:hypothetical protein